MYLYHVAHSYASEDSGNSRGNEQFRPTVKDEAYRRETCFRHPQKPDTETWKAAETRTAIVLTYGLRHQANANETFISLLLFQQIKSPSATLSVKDTSCVFTREHERACSFEIVTIETAELSEQLFKIHRMVA